jgi:hypothetical protein
MAVSLHLDSPSTLMRFSRAGSRPGEVLSGFCLSDQRLGAVDAAALPPVV